MVGEDLGREQEELQRQLDDIEGLGPWRERYDEFRDAAAKDVAPPTPQAAALAERLRHRLQDIEGVDVIVDGNTVRLEGDVATEQDLDFVNRAVADEQSRD